MAKKSTTKVYGFKATPMREQFKRERELLMRQMRRYEKQGYVFDSSVQVPSKKRAGQRITKSYIAKLQAMRKGLADVAFRVSEEGELLGTARERTHQRRGEYAQQQKLKKRMQGPPPPPASASSPAQPSPQLPPNEDFLIEHTAPPEEFEEYEPKPEPQAPSMTEYERPELPDIAHVIVNNFLSMFNEYANSPDAVGATMMVDAIEQMVAGYGYTATAKVLNTHMGMYPINDVAYSAQLANAVITAMLRELTGENLKEFESDGGYWPGDDLYE